MRYRATLVGLLIGLSEYFLDNALRGAWHPLDWPYAAEHFLTYPLVAVGVGYWADWRDTETKRLALRERQLAALNHASARVSRWGLDLDGVLQAIVTALVEEVGVAFARLWLADESGENLFLRASAGLYTRLDGSRSHINLSDYPYKLAQIARDQQPLVTNRVQEDERFDGLWAREQGLVAFAGYPLCKDEGLVAVLALFSRQPLDDAILDVLGSFANQAAVAIENARLHEVVQRHALELEQRVSERTAELSHANERLQVLSRVKDEFVSNVSHELRTPIASIKVHHELLTRQPHRHDELLTQLQRETERLEHIIEDLLHLSRLEQAQEPLRPTQVDLNSLASHCVADRTLLAESRGLTLSLTVTPGLPEVQGEPALLGQAFSVILTNALNYTPAGGSVTVTTLSRASEGGQWAGVCIRDTGPGIAPQEIPHLFDRFYRGAVGKASGVAGTGLGLAIAAEIVERHRGQIEVSSQGIPGDGATFTLWLPVPETRHSEQHSVQPSDSSV